MPQILPDRLSRFAEKLRQSLAEEVPGRERAWTETVHSALLGVKRALEEHKAAVETPEGLLTADPVPATLPKVSRCVNNLCQEHIDMNNQITALEEELHKALEAFKPPSDALTAPEPAIPVPKAVVDFGLIREAGERLLDALDKHLEAEGLLVLDTVNTDIGVGD
jgi:hypothetical protein